MGRSKWAVGAVERRWEEAAAASRRRVGIAGVAGGAAAGFTGAQPRHREVIVRQKSVCLMTVAKAVGRELQGARNGPRKDVRSAIQQRHFLESLQRIYTPVDLLSLHMGRNWRKGGGQLRRCRRRCCPLTLCFVASGARCSPAFLSQSRYVYKIECFVMIPERMIGLCGLSAQSKVNPQVDRQGIGWNQVMQS